MTKDNWIKALEQDINEILSHITSNMEKYRLNNYGHELPARPALDFMIKDLVKKYVSQVEKDAIDRGYKEGWNNAVNMDEWETRLQDAIEKTNKRWVERLAKFSRMGEISEKEVLQDFIKNKSDLLEDKK